MYGASPPPPPPHRRDERLAVIVLVVAVVAILAIPGVYFAEVFLAVDRVNPGAPAEVPIGVELSTLSLRSEALVDGVYWTNFSVGGLGTAVPLPYDDLGFQLTTSAGVPIVAGPGWSLTVRSAAGGADYSLRDGWASGGTTLVTPGDQWTVASGASPLHDDDLIVYGTTVALGGEEAVLIA